MCSLLNHVNPAPGDDGNPPLVLELVRMNLKDTMAPDDVDVAAKSVNHAIGLGHGHDVLALSVLEGSLSFHPDARKRIYFHETFHFLQVTHPNDTATVKF